MIHLREFWAWLCERKLLIRPIWWEIFRTTIVVSLCGGTLAEWVGIWPAQVLICLFVPAWLAVRIQWTSDRKKR